VPVHVVWLTGGGTVLAPGFAGSTTNRGALAGFDNPSSSCANAIPLTVPAKATANASDNARWNPVFMV